VDKAKSSTKVEQAYKDYLAYLVSEMSPVICPDYIVKLRLQYSPNEDDNDYETCEMETLTDTTYLRADIHVYPSLYTFWQSKEYEEIAAAVCHELLHVPMQPLVELAVSFLDDGDEDGLDLVRTEMERSVCRLAMTLTRLGLTELKPQKGTK